MYFIKILAWRCSDIFKAEYYSSTVQQNLVINKLNADLQQLQADFAISHLYNTNADYSPHSDCSTPQPRVVNRAGLFGSGSGSGLTFRKTSGLFRARYDAYK